MESNRPQSELSLVQVYSDKATSTMKPRALVRYPVNSILLNFRAEFKGNPIYNRHTMVRFLPVRYKDYSTLQGIDEQESRGYAAISKSLELVPLQNFIAQNTVSKGQAE